MLIALVTTAATNPTEKVKLYAFETYPETDSLNPKLPGKIEAILIKFVKIVNKIIVVSLIS